MNKIQKYLRNEMQAEEKRLFEEEVRKDAVLKRELLFQAKLFRALQLHHNQGIKQENASKDWIKNLETQAKAKPVFFVANWQAVAAIIILALGGILTYYLIDKQPSKEIMADAAIPKDSFTIAETPSNLSKTDTNLEKEIVPPKNEKQSLVKQSPSIQAIENKNAEAIALLQHNIDIKREIVRYQDSILHKTQKNVHGFLANKGLKWEWKTDSLAQIKWKITEKKCSTFYKDSLKKEKDVLLEELAAYKEMNKKL